VSILGPGEFFGYLPVIQQTPYSESATAMEDCDLVLIPKQDFFLMLTQKRDFTVQFIKMLANNVSENEKQLIKLAYDSVRKRVATALTILYDKYTEDPQHRFSILREDLASLAGTAKETVIRTLSDFKAEHLIDIDDGEIIVKDIDKLRDMPN
jgi:CRP-like cAMP-binding protein